MTRCHPKSITVSGHQYNQSLMPEEPHILINKQRKHSTFKFGSEVDVVRQDDKTKCLTRLDVIYDSITTSNDSHSVVFMSHVEPSNCFYQVQRLAAFFDDSKPAARDRGWIGGAAENCLWWFFCCRICYTPCYSSLAKGSAKQAAGRRAQGMYIGVLKH